MTQPSQLAPHALALGLAFLVAASGCASVPHHQPPVSEIPKVTNFIGNSGIPFSIPEDRPNACPATVGVDDLVKVARKNRLDFRACDVACLSLFGGVVKGLADGRLFGRCRSPNGSWGFAGMLVPTPGAPDGTYEVEQIKFITGPKTSAPELTLAR